MQEWSTRIVAQVTAAAGGAKESDVTKMAKDIVFPWGEDDEVVTAPVDEDDLSYLETGDTRAADKNAGKNLGPLGMLTG